MRILKLMNLSLVSNSFMLGDLIGQLYIAAVECKQIDCYFINSHSQFLFSFN